MCEFAQEVDVSSYKVRDWVSIGLFGALWGVVETTLGTYLNVIFPSFTNTFFKGVILGSIGVAVALTGRFFVRKRGSLLLIGVITALLKTLSPAGSRIGPILAILMQSVLMEVVLSVAGDPRRWAFVLGGALAVGWNFPHKFIMMRMMYGRNIVQVYQELTQDGSRMLGLDPSLALLILSLLLLVRLVAGGIAGWGAWALGGAVAERLGQRSQVAAE
jgi:ABC-type thiamin/hydroxymethylpyrimidine transport system permease subunit